MPERNLVPRDQLTEAELSEALRTCAEEPIHIPSLIQPHGLLIVIDPETDLICQISANTLPFLGREPAAYIGTKLEDLFGTEQTAKIYKSVRKHDLRPVKATTITGQGRIYNAAVHVSEGFVVVELEIDAETQDEKLALRENMADLVRDFAVEVHNTKNTKAMYDLLVTSIREVTGFDRVKLYIFDEDWNGAISAEARADFMPSYLGLTFPSTDIPDQARKLYAKSYLRLIADIHYRPVPLFPASPSPDRRPLDMSYSLLRSVSPIHIQYLDNINVSASMSISIMQDGELWGLVACHHSKPHWIPYETRVLAESMGHIFSAKLSAVELIDEQFRITQKNKLIESLSIQLNNMISPNEILYQHRDVAMDALSAQGLAIRTKQNTYSFGDTPELGSLNQLFEWCKHNLKNNIIYTRDAQQYLKNRNVHLDVSGGFLAVPVGQLEGDVAIWFRNEKTREVFWAGNPEKPVEQTKAGYRLTPRASFDLWRTTTKGKSDIWSESDIATALSIAQIIVENEGVYAERSSAAKTEFLSSMSHELRTPLGAVIGIVEILKRDTTLTPRQREMISTLDMSSGALLNLINDLLDIAKIEANEIQFEEVEFTAESLMNDIHTLMHIQAREKKLAFNVHYDEKCALTFVSDTTKLKQVLINLVGNAIKFTDKGYVNVSLTVDSCVDQLTWITFEVADSGVGIAEDKVDKIFEKFAQADVTITRKFGGTGLGLFITKTIVSAMGGKIEVRSKPGLGSRFLVTLPVMCLPKAETATEATEDTMPGKADHAHQILLVEDKENNILVANFFLDERGFKTTVVNNGQEALDILKERTFDLVIMDIQMPVMDGLTATRLIRSREAAHKLPRLPIMAMTANALTEDRQACFDAGMDAYISKPIRVDEMNRKIDELLKKDD